MPRVRKAVAKFPLHGRKGLSEVLQDVMILKAIGEHSKRNGTDHLSSREITNIIKAARAERAK